MSALTIRRTEKLSTRFTKFAALWLAVGFLFGLAGCGKSPKPRSRQGTLDTPAHHVLRGQDMIRQNRWQAAQRQFELALELKPNYAPALGGKALVAAYQSGQEGRTPERVQELREAAGTSLEAAFDNAAMPSEKLAVRVWGIRTRTVLQGDDWLETVESYFEEVAELIEDNPKLRNQFSGTYFYLGEAYLAAQSFAKASEQFRQVLTLNSTHTAEADRHLELLNKITRAQPGSRHGKVMALVSEVTRADLAALLIEEFHLAELYARRVSGTAKKSSQSGYESPVKKFSAEQKKKIPAATDIAEHPLREDIQEILRLRVRGLEANPQHLFFPNKNITRAEYALMLEDILIQVTQDRSLATRFIGESSPWQDVRPDAYYYNAARTLTARNILSVKNQVRGEFGPNEAVHGADVLLSLRLLKDELKSYLRSSGN